jgi:hypothetical protein
MSWDAWFSRYTLPSIGVTYFSSVTTTHSALSGVLKTHNTEQESVVVRRSWNTKTTNTETCYCNSRTSTAAREDALRYPARHNPDVNVLRGLEQRLRETESVTPTAHVNVGSPRTVRTPANVHTVEREPWRSSRDIARKLGIIKTRVLKVLPDD